MASSEIEIVSDSNEVKPSDGNPTTEPRVVDVFSAAAYGDFDKLRKFVQNDGVSVSQSDGNGYYPLQWAALNNFADIVQYIVERGGEVNAKDNAGQTALHWAAVRGSIAAADVLLQNGGRVEAADINGYRAVHVAAQYGQTAFLNYVIAQHHADFDVPDNDGRTPLHWSMDSVTKGFKTWKPMKIHKKFKLGKLCNKITKITKVFKTLKPLFRMFSPAAQVQGYHQPVKEDDLPSFMTFIVKVDTSKEWEKKVSKLIKSCQGPRFKMDREGVVELSGIGYPDQVLKKIGKSRKKVQLLWFQFGECSANLFMPETKKNPVQEKSVDSNNNNAIPPYRGYPLYSYYYRPRPQIKGERAAYKGFTDTIRLLLFRDASQGKQDKEGCTPLHWAALRGHLEACSLLAHAGSKEELVVKDKAGKTPVELASDKGHRHIALFLSNALRSQSKQWHHKICCGHDGKFGYAPFLFSLMVISLILFTGCVLFAPNLTKVTATVGLWGWTGVSLAVASLIMLTHCSSKDPGYIETGTGNQSDAEDPLLNIDLNNNSTWNGNWSQLCPTCKIIRPVRSKHCAVCKRCVEQFDHHCPWISNCVGKRNKRDFVTFLVMGTLTTSIGGMVAIQRIWTSVPALSTGETWTHHVIFEYPGVIAFLVLDAAIFFAATTLLAVQAYQIARNVTTNEVANAMRYGYLRGPDGRFRNPYNHGCWKNCSDFLIHGHTDDDEIAWPPLQQIAS